VAEGDKEAPAATGEVPPELEARGTGVNKYAYWVTDSVTGEWAELPDATPTTIKLARQLKKMFNGSLDAEVVSNPFFAGKEKELLRAQIARITQATTIVPKGLYKKKEDSNTESVDEEEKKMPSFEQLTSLDSWCHFLPTILKVRNSINLPIFSAEEPLIFSLNLLKILLPTITQKTR